MRRVEWVGEGHGDGSAHVDDGDSATLSDFAYESTYAVLATEPRVQTIATLVAKAGPLDAATWREVGALVGTFLGPAGSVARLVPCTSESQRVAPLLGGEATRRRFIAALRDLTGQV